MEKEVVINRENDIVRSVQINEQLSEEKGQYTSVFHYKLDKELGVGIGDNGEPAEAFCTVTLEHNNLIDYDHFHQNVCRHQVAGQGDCDPKFITPISEDEYRREMADKNEGGHPQ